MWRQWVRCSPAWRSPGGWGGEIEARFVVHGLLVGVVAMLIYIALTRAQPEPFAYVLAHGLKLLGAVCGGLLAGRRKTAS